MNSAHVQKPKLSFSIESILGKFSDNVGLSLSGSFSSTNTSSESSSNSPPLMLEQRIMQLENMNKNQIKIEQDSGSSCSPDSKLLSSNSPDKSTSQISCDFSPLWNDLMLRRHGSTSIEASNHFDNFTSSPMSKPNYLSQSHLVKSLNSNVTEKSPVSSSAMGRSPRVPFSRHQVMVLESKFRKTHYLSSLEVTELANQLHLTETRVKIWFQNRRARERRENAVSGLTSPLEGGFPRDSESNYDSNDLHDPSKQAQVNQEIGEASPMQQMPYAEHNISGLTPLLLQVCWAAQKQLQRPELCQERNDFHAITPMDTDEAAPFLKLKSEPFNMYNKA